MPSRFQNLEVKLLKTAVFVEANGDESGGAKSVWLFGRELKSWLGKSGIPVPLCSVQAELQQPLSIFLWSSNLLYVKTSKRERFPEFEDANK
jgi:hypothetical protein